jgi:hypothetical protein
VAITNNKDTLPSSIEVHVLTPSFVDLGNVQWMEANRIAAFGRLVLWIVIKHTSVDTILLIHVSDLDPHSFALSVNAFCCLFRETENQFDMIARLAILPSSLRRRVKIIAEL